MSRLTFVYALLLATMVAICSATFDDLIRPRNYRWDGLIDYKRSVFGGYGKNGRAALLNAMYG